MIKKVAFTMYPVKDMDRARSFYEGALGLKIGPTYSEGKWVEYDLPGGGCFAITTEVPDLEPSNNRGGSIAFEVDDLDATLADLKAKKVEMATPIIQSPVCRMAVALDSEGNGAILHEVKKK